MSTPADCNLLLGVLALQLNFVTREQLVAVVTSWLLEKETPLGQLFERQKILTTARRQLLEALVDEHLRQHGGDVEQSLATLSSLGPVRDELQRLGDAELSISLSRVAGGAAAARDDAALSDLPATSSFSNPGPGTESAAEDSTPRRLRFRILRSHAEGGLGRVLVAHDEELHREVALKEIKPQFAMDVDSRNRFTLEAEVTGGLEHPGIVPVYGLGQYSDGRPYYAMRFIRGDSLKEAIEQFHAMPRAQIASLETAPTIVTVPTLIATEPASRLVSSETFAAVEFRKLLGRFIDVCQAIEYAHSRGVLHRDLKPGNIMLGKYGETLVVDWGLAKVAGKDDRFANVDEATLVPSSGSSIENTADGSVIGTPAYMSPEQAAGRLEQLGPATDVYSLGATLYHVLTGRSPFSKLPLPELLARVQRGDFPHPRELNSSIPKPLEAVCLKAMALQPEHRYESAAAIAEDIEHWLADEPVNAHREGTLAQSSRWVRKHRAWAMSGAAALAIVAIVATIAALLVNGQNNVIAEQERAATKLANEKSALAEREKSAREKADLSAADALRQTKLVERHLYVAHMNLAQSAWEEARVGQTLRMLDLHRPQAGTEGGPDDLRGFEWFYWDRCCHSDLLTFKGHTSSAYTVAFSPDGQRLASGSADGTVKVWDASTGQESLTLTLERHDVTSVAFSPDGKRLAAADQETVTVWDTATGQKSLTVRGYKKSAFLKLSASNIVGVAFSPDGRRLAAASFDGTVKVWDAATGQESLTLEGHTNAVLSVAFSPDGKRLASTSADQMVKVWDAATGQTSLTLEGHTSFVTSVAFSPDGLRLASASDDKTVKVWDAATGQESRTLKGHTASVFSVAFSPDGQWLASASDDRTVKVWDAVTGHESRTLKGHTANVSSVAFSPDGQRLASASGDGTVKVWDAAKGQDSLTLKGHTNTVKSVALSPDGQRLASASDDQTVKVWDAVTGQESFTLKGHTANVSSVAFSPDGQRLASASGDQTVKVWNAVTGQESLTLKGHTGNVVCVVFSPDGKRLASASDDQTVKVWDATTGQESLTLEAQIYLKSVAFSPDGKRLASAGLDKTVKVWNAATGEESLTLEGHTSFVMSVTFSPVGKRLASAGWDGTFKVWDAETGQESFTLEEHTDCKVMSVAFSPDGKRLASASDDRTVKVWNVDTGQASLTLKGHTNTVTSVAFSPDGKRLASASDDGTVKVWNATPDARSESTALERAIVRMEREAQTALARHRKTMATYEELQAALRDDKSISTAVRSKALELATQQMSLEAQTVLNRHRELMATYEELQAALRDDKTISTAVRSKALELATQLVSLEEAPTPDAVAADFSALRSLGSHELLYVCSNRTIAAQRFDNAKVSTFSTIWLDVPLLIAKPKTRSVFVLCKNRLFELVADGVDRPRELRRFPQSVHDLAFHPTEDRIAWCRRADLNAAPELIVSRLDGTDETNLGFGYDPVWSADGQKLIYTGATSEDGWFIAIREGTQTRRIKVPVHPSIHVYPCPAPDGKQIAFSMKGEDGTMQIGLTSLDGADIRQLTRTGDFNTKPAFSPDGKYLAFIRGQQPTPRVIIVNVETGMETVISEHAQSSRPVWITNP